MDRFAVDEGRMLYFHRVLIEQARQSPGLIARAQDSLARMRGRRPDAAAMWDQWETLLAGPLDALATTVCAASAQAGLLRANSPLADALAPEERNALWQRIGLHQFAALYLQAAKDLGLTTEEQGAILAVPADSLAAWRDGPPVSMSAATLDGLKLVVAIHRGLERLFDDADLRRAWLRARVDVLPAPPIDLLTSGRGGLLQAYLTAALQPLIPDSDRPSH
ncbi:MAG: hypothetical protein ACM33T_00985 [Solirubrobacterales bacterium]